APAAAAAGWAEGFLAGSGLLLLHDDKLLGLADGWLAGLSADAFAVVLPALRRTFGQFAPPERQAIGDKAARLDGSGRPPPTAEGEDEDPDEGRAPAPGRTGAGLAASQARDRGYRGWAPQPRRWPAGSATSGRSSRSAWCRSCRRTRSSGS